jgi:hypothetical protein
MGAGINDRVVHGDGVAGFQPHVVGGDCRDDGGRSNGVGLAGIGAERQHAAAQRREAAIGNIYECRIEEPGAGGAVRSRGVDMSLRRDGQIMARGLDRAAIAALGPALGADRACDLGFASRIDRNRAAIALRDRIGRNLCLADIDRERIGLGARAVEIAPDEHRAAARSARSVELGAIGDHNRVAEQLDRAAGLARGLARRIERARDVDRPALAGIEHDLTIHDGGARRLDDPRGVDDVVDDTPGGARGQHHLATLGGNRSRVRDQIGGGLAVRILGGF